MENFSYKKLCDKHFHASISCSKINLKINILILVLNSVENEMENEINWFVHSEVC